MPDVRNLYIDDAVTELKKSDLDFILLMRILRRWKKDHIIAQQIEPEQIINKGTHGGIVCQQWNRSDRFNSILLIGMDQDCSNGTFRPESDEGSDPAGLQRYSRSRKSDPV